MKTLRAVLSVLLMLPSSWAYSAVQDFRVKYRIPVMDYYGFSSYETQRQNYAFRVDVISDEGGEKTESWKNGRPFVAAKPNERYSIRIYNPLPVRVAVNLTVDGVNTISGKPSGIADGEKWIIDPYGTMVLRGWQVNGAETRRFFFTDTPKSYAAWRGEELHKDLSANCGVIGAAFFWSRKELNQYWDEHPIYRNSRPVSCATNGVATKARAQSTASPAASMGALESLRKGDARDELQEKAGTGMGERESHLTVRVDFDYDSGMYQPSQAIVLYYDFAKPLPHPNPFPELSYAPEMP